MLKKRIYLCLAHMSGKEQHFIQEAFDTNWVVPLGPNVNGFEDDLKKYLGDKNEVVALSSGTAALHLALIACNIVPGDEVLVQSFTFCASSNPIIYLGASPVFIDSEFDTWNLDPELLEIAIIDRIKITGKKPKAIVIVYLYGMPAKLNEIFKISYKYNIPVIEDAAEGFGSKYSGQACGTFGKYGVLSFNGNKMITTSGGGALITQSVDEKNKIMFYSTQAREAYPYYHHEKIGYNYRMSNICAGIGRGQMTIVEEHVIHHKHVQKLYEDLLMYVKGINIHVQPTSGEFDSNYWLCTATIDPEVIIKGQENLNSEIINNSLQGAVNINNLGLPNHTDCEPNNNVEALRIFLDLHGIECRPLWKPMHKQPIYKGYTAYVNNVSETLFKTGICLPAGPCVTDNDVIYIVECIKKAIS